MTKNTPSLSKPAPTSEKRKALYAEIEPIVKKYKDDVPQRSVS